MTCGKVPFRSKAEALRAAAGLSRRQFSGWRGRQPFVRAYRCAKCKGTVWHMTRSKPRVKKV